MKTLILDIVNYRNEQVFDDLLTTVFGISNAKFCMETIPKRKRKLSSIMSAVRSQAVLKSREFFRAGIFYQDLDMMLNELRIFRMVT